MLISFTDLLIFLTAALSLNLTPGNDMMYVLGQSLKGGPRNGICRGSKGIAQASNRCARSSRGRPVSVSGS